MSVKCIVENEIDALFQFMSEATTPVQAVRCAARLLAGEGYLPLDIREEWKLSAGGKYYVEAHGTAFAAFTLPPDCGYMELPALRITAAHTDSPCLKVKASPEIERFGVYQLNVEPYGGLIMNTWFDRPLSMAGRVMLRQEADGGEGTETRRVRLEERLVDWKRPVLTIPNLCIHQNRDINSGVPINPQRDMLPVLQTGMGKFNLIQALAEELDCPPERIEDYDLYLYVWEKPLCCGLDGGLISAARLDNLASCIAALRALHAAEPSGGNAVNMAVFFDNEEVGSQTKQGADSMLLPFLLEKLAIGLGMSREEYLRFAVNGRLISADASHATHPNYFEKSDPTNLVTLDGGVALKLSAAQKYASDIQFMAELELMCRTQEIPLVKYYNHSNEKGGSTMGPMLSSLLPMQTLDIGVPMLAMHSARELIHKKSYAALVDLLTAFYSDKNE